MLSYRDAWKIRYDMEQIFLRFLDCSKAFGKRPGSNCRSGKRVRMYALIAIANDVRPNAYPRLNSDGGGDQESDAYNNDEVFRRPNSDRSSRKQSLFQRSWDDDDNSNIKQQR